MILRSGLCVVAAISIALWFLIIDLLSYYASLFYGIDTFYLGAGSLLVFLIALAWAVVSLSRRLFSPAGSRRKAWCAALVAAAACIAFISLRHQQALAADWFFLLNAQSFSKKLPDNPEDPAYIVYMRTSASAFKLIAFIRAADIVDGRQSLATIMSLGPAFDPFYSCSITARRLRDRFYLFAAC